MQSLSSTLYQPSVVVWFWCVGDHFLFLVKVVVDHAWLLLFPQSVIISHENVLFYTHLWHCHNTTKQFVQFCKEHLLMSLLLLSSCISFFPFFHSIRKMNNSIQGNVAGLLRLPSCEHDIICKASAAQPPYLPYLWWLSAQSCKSRVQLPSMSHPVVEKNVSELSFSVLGLFSWSWWVV